MSDYDAFSVMVLDGHRDMRSIIRAILRGFEIRRVHECATIAEAMATLNGAPVDAVLFEGYLPDGDGPGFVRAVRGLEENPHRFAPLVLCSSLTTADRLKSIVDAGVDEAVAKPVSARALMKRLQATVERRRAFVETPTYFGPDRRRRTTTFTGPDRRTAAPSFIEPPDRDRSRELFRQFLVPSAEEA